VAAISAGGRRRAADRNNETRGKKMNGYGRRRERSLCAAGLALTFMAAGMATAQDQPPSMEEMWRIIQEQQREIERLKAKLSETDTKVQAADEKIQAADKKIEAADQKIEATGEMVEQVAAKEPAAGMVEGWWNRTSIGGYGELHYNGGDTDEIDFHRFVLYFSHQFNDKLRFHSELELEHALAGEDAEGEIELEQAFVEYDFTDKLQGRAGLFLVPVGILNETHEPPTFFGVERNIVETNIVPTTWWEGGLAGRAVLGRGFSADLAYTSGLDVSTTGSSAYLPRSGRQKVSEAVAKNAAVTGRLKWTGVPGVELALTGQYQDDITQGAQGIDATLLETHAAVRRGPWSLRALYARWDLGGEQPKAIGRDEQYGWYVEPGFILGTRAGDVGLFARYAVVDNSAGDSTDSKLKESTVGINYWPHPQVVLKADYQWQEAPSGVTEDDRINLGLGLMF
jgi:hypothetical protein